MTHPTAIGRAALRPAPMSPDEIADLVARVSRTTDERAKVWRAVDRVLRGEKPSRAAAAEVISDGGWFYSRIRQAKRGQAKPRRRPRWS